MTMLRTNLIGFRPIRDKLNETADREKQANIAVNHDPHLVSGEENAAVLDEKEPEPMW